MLHLRAGLAVRELAGRGRGVVALQALSAGSVLLNCTPMAQVLKTPKVQGTCSQCLSVTEAAAAGTNYLCSSDCVSLYNEGGGPLLERLNLAPLKQQLHGRNFPLLVASLLASLLADLKAGRPPQDWEPLQLCFAELDAEATPQLEAEHKLLLHAFMEAGIATQSTLELLMPASRYRRLVGACSLNAFELTLSHGARVSALLPGVVSCFNHSCDPNVLIRLESSHHVSFEASSSLAAGEELCISYVDLNASCEDRRHMLLSKYAFECDCLRCQAEAR